jgi:trehalose-phosphatase
VVERLGDRTLLAFLDFDGTLSPIVDEPSQAVLAPGMGDVIERLSRRALVAVVSGRGADDVRARIGRTDVWTAGSHGFEIVSPSGERHDHPDAAPAQAALDLAAESLEASLRAIEGVRIEPKHLGLSVHDRMVADDDVAEVRAAVLAQVEQHPRLRATHGKRVIELRPDIDWDKGAAVAWLQARVAGDRAVSLYIGDDTTDEDAFAVIGTDGVTIVVAGSDSRASIAEWSVSDTDEVRAVLERLAEVDRDGT